jgi:hypothetical protein
LEKASTKELASKICGLLGVKFNAVLEHTVLHQTAVVVRLSQVFCTSTTSQVIFPILHKKIDDIIYDMLGFILQGYL